jgi:toxin ParE1/3/4
VKTHAIHREAVAEIDEAMAYYEQQRRGLGLEFRAEVDEALAWIQQDPNIGTPFKRSRFRFFVLRRFPYVIYYAEEPTFVWVVAVAHARRRLGYWRKRKVE